MTFKTNKVSYKIYEAMIDIIISINFLQNIYSKCIKICKFISFYRINI